MLIWSKLSWVVLLPGPGLANLNWICSYICWQLRGQQGLAGWYMMASVGAFLRMFAHPPAGAPRLVHMAAVAFRELEGARFKTS